MYQIFHFDITEERKDRRRTDRNFSDVCKRDVATFPREPRKNRREKRSSGKEFPYRSRTSIQSFLMAAKRKRRSSFEAELKRIPKNAKQLIERDCNRCIEFCNGVHARVHADDEDLASTRNFLMPALIFFYPRARAVASKGRTALDPVRVARYIGWSAIPKQEVKNSK